MLPRAVAIEVSGVVQDHTNALRAAMAAVLLAYERARQTLGVARAAE